MRNRDHWGAILKFFSYEFHFDMIYVSNNVTKSVLLRILNIKSRLFTLHMNVRWDMYTSSNCFKLPQSYQLGSSIPKRAIRGKQVRKVSDKIINYSSSSHGVCSNVSLIDNVPKYIPVGAHGMVTCLEYNSRAVGITT